MTLNEAVQIVYRRWQQSTDYPDSTAEDYLIIKGALNDAINKWGGTAQEDSVKWKELFTNLADASDGDKTTTASTSQYDAPSDFVEISSFVKMTDSDSQSLYYPYKKQDDVLRALKENTSEQFFYITGNSGSGYKININPAPISTGNTIAYSYYKLPTELSATTDTFEMSRPYFAVYDALASILEEERPDLAQTYMSRAASLMDKMLIDNEIPPFNHPYQLRDLDYTLEGSAFGL